MWEIVSETLLDSVKMLPFLFGAYLLIEYLAHGAGDKLKALLKNLGVLGSLGGAILGLIPQCGFSVAAANFYSQRIITTGTLFAVFLATSDEAIPVLLANQGSGDTILKLMGIKLVIAAIGGVLVDLILSAYRRGTGKTPGQLLFQSVDEVPASCCSCCGHRGEDQGLRGFHIIRTALLHSAKVFFFILLVTFALNAGLYFLGEDRVAGLLMSGSKLQPLLAGLLGLIPNCAPSVILTELYLEGSISLGSAVAGLSTGAGLGLAVLFRVNPNKKESLLITAGLYATGVAAGFLIG